MISEIAPEELRHHLLHGEELALLDVREQGEFAEGHLLQASCLPLSRFELLIGQLVCCRQTPVILTGDEKSGKYRLVERAAEWLERHGYAKVFRLAEGNRGWQRAGYPLFSGINTLSKAFGEFVEQSCGTPRMTPAELRIRIQTGERPAIFDARPDAEFYRNSIPGAGNLPGAELLYRIHDRVTDPEQLVVINCAGRTRSIIGTQSLINAGFPNPVVALENGTMGWHLAGFPLEHGRRLALPEVSPAGLEAAARAAGRLASRYGVRRLDSEGLAELCRERGDVSTITRLDVRSPEEFAAGHLAGFRNAPGGQLVQATDDYVAVRNGVVVLADNDTIRATLAASWLNQMGLPEVYVLAGDDGENGLNPAGEAVGEGPELPRITASQLRERLAGGTVLVIDVASSREYRQGHIPGAAWIIRARLDVDLRWDQPPELTVLTSETGTLATMAGSDLGKLRPEVPVAVLEGGTASWKGLGLPLESGLSQCLSAVEDVWYRPYERSHDSERSMREYLSWEVGLLQAVARDGTARFNACGRKLGPGSH